MQKGQSLVFGRDTHTYKMFDKENLEDNNGYDGTKRQRTQHVDGKVSKNDI